MQNNQDQINNYSLNTIQLNEIQKQLIDSGSVVNALKEQKQFLYQSENSLQNLIPLNRSQVLQTQSSQPQQQQLTQKQTTVSGGQQITQGVQNTMENWSKFLNGEIQQQNDEYFRGFEKQFVNYYKDPSDLYNNLNNQEYNYQNMSPKQSFRLMKLNLNEDQKQKKLILKENMQNWVSGERFWVNNQSKINSTKEMKNFIVRNHQEMKKSNIIYERGQLKRIKSLQKEQDFFNSPHLSPSKIKSKISQLDTQVSVQRQRLYSSSVQRMSSQNTPTLKNQINENNYLTTVSANFHNKATQPENAQPNQDYELKYIEYASKPILVPSNQINMSQLKQINRCFTGDKIWPAKSVSNFQNKFKNIQIKNQIQPQLQLDTFAFKSNPFPYNLPQKPPHFKQQQTKFKKQNLNQKNKPFFQLTIKDQVPFDLPIHQAQINLKTYYENLTENKLKKDFNE